MLVGVGLILALFTAYLVVPRTSGDRDWKAESEDERAAAIAKHEPQFLQILKEGDSAWDAGKKDDGVQHYSQLLAQFCGHGQSDRTGVAELHKPEMARAAGRTIDFLADSGNNETAKDLIRKADQSDLVIVYSSPKVNRLVIESKADQQKEEKEVDDWLEREEQKDGRDSQSTFPASPNDDGLNDADLMDMEERYKSLVNRVKPGMSKEQVEAILGMADESDEKDMGELNPQKAGQMLDICTWHGDTESQSSIILSFVNGRLQDGGTPGYDIRKGFSSQLPANMTPEEKAKVRKAAKGLGINTEDE